MWNAANNRLRRIALALSAAAVMTLCQCGGSDTGNGAATQALTQAQQAYDSQQYQECLTQIAAIDSLYPKAVDIRRQAMGLRAQATEGLTLQQIVVADSMLLVCQEQIDVAEHQLEHVNDPRQVEGYWTAAGKRANLMTSAGIEGRVDEDHEFYIIVSAPGLKGISAIEVTQTTPQGSAIATRSASIPAGDERSMGSQAIFNAFAVDSLRDALALNATSAIAVDVLNGQGKVIKHFALTAAQAQGLTAAAQFAYYKQLLKSTLIERERLERTLNIARNQIANTTAQ